MRLKISFTDELLLAFRRVSLMGNSSNKEKRPVDGDVNSTNTAANRPSTSAAPNGGSVKKIGVVQR